MVFNKVVVISLGHMYPDSLSRGHVYQSFLWSFPPKAIDFNKHAIAFFGNQAK